MDAVCTTAEEAVPRRRRRLRLGRALAVLILVLLVVLWLVRVPVATRFVDRTLARDGVRARYQIADLGLGRQRLTDVSIGDPSSPDLTADWIETDTGMTFRGPVLTGVRAGRVRLRGRVLDGRVSLGEIDRLLPRPTNKPFALPALKVELADGHLELTTPAGAVQARLSGRGNLADGFRGRFAAMSDELSLGGCVAGQVRASGSLAIDNGAPTVAGPITTVLARCGAWQGTGGVRLALALGPALDRWRGLVAVRDFWVIGASETSLQRIAGSIRFAGNARATAGTLALAAGPALVEGTAVRSLRAAGAWRVADGMAFRGHVSGDGIAASAAVRSRLAGSITAAAGTPVAPLARKAVGAAAEAARDFTASAQVSYDGGEFAFTRLTVKAASGARASLDGGAGLRVGDGIRVDGRLRASGGGLPTLDATLRQAAPGAPIAGIATLAPYAADGASLALTPVRFTAGLRGATHVSTVATLTGPLADGRVEALRTPLDARWNGGTLTLNPACAPLAFQSLRVSGLRLAPSRLALCPLDGALLRVASGRVSGGARVAAPRLTGAIGSTPLTLAAQGATVRLGDTGFVVIGLQTRIGRADSVTRIDAARLDGRATAQGLAGSFAGAAGQVGAVPLLLSDAAGTWRLVKGRLALDGVLKVVDAQATSPRFQPMTARDVTLTLVNGRIAARGTLAEPTTGTKVADVTIDHALPTGRGEAMLTVPSLTFRDGFQPDLLTRLTFGVIADVQGTVTGAGRIAWSPEGVTSTGDFATTKTDLAAAFGPVTGIAGTIHFTDLLALQSAPGQVATIAAINPGIGVTDGRVTYQTLPNARLQVEGGRWPFAGGTLTLEPTLLDFTADKARRLTFAVSGMQARAFLQQFDFDNLDATGVFDGTLPMVFDQSGGRIENGRLTVREGGGTLAYVGDLTQKDLGTWGNIAFQALKSLRYRNLNIVMNGPLAGEMVTEVRFAGVSQGEGAKGNFLVKRLQKLPFVFNIRIKAPFRGLLDSVASFYDPKRLVQRNLQQLLDEQNKRTAPPVQPPASEKVP